MATITDPTLTQGRDVSGQTVYVSNPELNPQFNYNLPSTISASSLQTPQTPINPGTPPDQSAMGNHVDGMNQALTSLTPPTDTTSTGSTDMEALFSKYLGSQTPPPSSTDAYNTLYNNSDVAAKQQKAIQSQNNLDTINAQLAAKNYEYTTLIPNQIKEQFANTGGGGLQQGINDRTGNLQRQKMLEIAPLQFQALIANAENTGNQRLYQAAQEHLDRVFTLQQQDAQAQYQYRTNLIDKVYQYADKQQQAKLDAQKVKAQNDFTLMTNNLNNAQAIAKSASDNGQPEIAAKILGLDPHSPTYAQDVAKLQGQIVVKQDQWSAPYSLGGDIVQKNTKTGEIRTAVNVAAGGGGNTPVFSNTQINKGANNAALPTADFKALDPEVQNYYVQQSPAQAKQMADVISTGKFTDTTTGTTYTAQEMIDSSNTTDAVKTYLKSLLKAPTATSGGWTPLKNIGDFIGDVWKNITGS